MTAVYPFPDITPNANALRLLSNVEVFTSPFNGATSTSDREGERLLFSLNLNNLQAADRRAMMSFVTKSNGPAARVSLRDHSYNVPSGALVVAEMLDIAFNATNWEVSTAAPDRGSIADTTGGVRFTAGVESASVPLTPTTFADAISVPVVGVSYAATIYARDPRPAPSNAGTVGAVMAFRDDNFGLVLSESAVFEEAARIVVAATCPDAADLFVRPAVFTDGVADKQGASIDLLRLSVARCLLVDNGVNALTRSQEFDDAAWTRVRSTISADAADGPDGTTTADELIEDSSAATTHYVTQTHTRASESGIWTASIVIEENTQQRISFTIDDGSSANRIDAFFDANTGTITNGPTVTGTASHGFASIHDLGNGRYRCRLTVELAATTSVRFFAYLCAGATNITSYNGDGSSGLYIWGAQLQQGSQLGRYTETAAAATTGTTQSGKAVWLKGLDASTPGQLLEGDQIEVNGQLTVLDEDLDGDASGCGLARVSPRIRSALADETPVILYRPHGVFMLATPENGWSNVPGIFSSSSLQFVEDIAI